MSDLPIFREEILAALPLSDDQLVAAASKAGASAEDLAFARAANRQVGLLRSLPRPVLPAGSTPERMLGRIHDATIAESMARLRESPAGDLLAAGLGPVEVPRDVDWSANDWSTSVLEDLTGTGRSAERIGTNLPPTPGWLWLRIRGDLQELRSGSAHRPLVKRPRLRFSRRTVAAAAALLIATVVVAGIESGRLSFGGRSERGHHDFVLQRVDQPLAGDFSITAIVGEVSRGSR